MPDYYCYELSCIEENKTVHRTIIEEFKNVLGGFSPFEFDYHWRNRDETIKKVSAKFPDVIIQIDCYGSYNGQIFRIIAIGGELGEFPADISFPGAEDFILEKLIDKTNE